MIKVLQFRVRLWTIQPFEVWEQLQRAGDLLVDEARLPDGGYVPPAYRWLAGELTSRVPGYSGTLPWWAYCKKPDLRLFRHHRPAGHREVRLELEPSPGRYVIFPVWAWDTVHGGDYLAPTAAEHASWMETVSRLQPDEGLRSLPEPWRSQLEASWSRLFGPDLPAFPWDRSRIGQSGSREAVLGSLRLEEVRRVTSFVGCGRRP